MEQAQNKDDARKPDPRGTAPALRKAPAPSLPKGGGAIRGIGEKFSANTFSGTAALAVPIATTPARSGFHPELSLQYDSGSGNGPFGLGWHLSIPNISRKTDKRLPEYRDAEESDVYLLSGAEDLVPAPDSDPPVDDVQIRRYRPRIEGLFARIERHENVATGDVHWVSITPNNVRNVYGASNAARIADPRDPAHRVFTWLLERSEDALGNVIVYEYTAEDLANVTAGAAEAHRLDGTAAFTNRYVTRIRYGNTVPGDERTCVFDVAFDYGQLDAERPEPQKAPGTSWAVRPDPFSTYRAGFEVRTYRLCRRVLLFHTFPEELGAGPCLVRATKLDYSPEEHSTLSRLATLTHEGYVRAASGAYSPEAYPPLKLGYAEAEIHTKVQALDPSGVADGIGGVDGKVHQWADLDGEGIPGLVTDDGGALWYRRNLGGGVLESPRCLMTRPSTTALARGAQQLMDLAGDGRLELIELGGTLPGYYERIPPGDPGLGAADLEDGGWESFRPFAARPDLDWTDPNLRFIDLNGDGRDDLLVARDDVFVWYPSLGEDGYDAPRTFPRPRDEEQGPAIVFADASHTVFLADLGGDGLRDLVRVGNGSVCYWPNLGHGRFGAKVTMAAAPVFDAPDQFQPSRILFADIDGSGTTDLIYAGRQGVRFWFNQAGNSWGEAQELPGLRLDSAVNVTAADILGTGTACLVWSSPLPGDDAARLRYVDLLDSRKPHLLVSIDNGLGFTTRLQYAPSTKFYLADRAAGEPWHTRLAFPVHVLERVETYDAVRHVRFVSEYKYRDGEFDGHEREFRGFGYVEQWDTESHPAPSGLGLFADRPPAVNGESPQPPVVTETWFHTGRWLLDGLPDGLSMVLPDGLTPDEQRDAYRALKGQVLRQRIRCEDGSERRFEPYKITDHSYEVRREQSARGDSPAVFFTHAREVIERHTERDPADPRVQHAVTLEVDPYGHVRRSVAIGYPRREGTADFRAEQGRLLATLTEVDVANVVNETNWYRHGVPLATRTYELGGLSAGASPFLFEQVKEAADEAVAAPYDDAFSNVAPFVKHLIEHVRARYYDSHALPAALPWGAIDRRALPCESYGLAFTSRMLESLYGGRVDDAVLAEGGYVRLDDPNDPAGGADWWVPSGRALPALPFYLPTSFHDPFGHVTSVAYDEPRWLLPVETRDAKGNVVRVDNDYRTMSPRLVTDPNGNRTSVEVDALGRVTATRVMGKEGSTDGDPGGERTTMLEYAFYDGAQPSVVHLMARETHGAADTRWQHTYTYSDGAGHEVMKKVQAEPGRVRRRAADGSIEEVDVVARWVGTGRTVFDNKGNPIKQYEPFFSDTPAYETDEELVVVGVTPLLHYDPLGRLILTEMPDGTTARVAFSPWQQKSWDAVDTVWDAGNLWHAEQAASPDPLKRRAAQLAWDHRDTPAVTVFDTLGRAFLSIANNGPGEAYETRTELDIEGNPLVVWDALERPAMTRRFNMAGQACHQVSIDAGERWMLVDVLGGAWRAWDLKGHELRTQYDELRRPTHLFVVEAGGAPRLAERTEYGEGSPEARERNRLGRVYRHFDAAGVVTNEEYDFKGNPTRVTRGLAAEYTSPLDWSARPEPALVDEPPFAQVTEYDALNRPTRVLTPDGSETRPSYNEAGLLDRVEARVHGIDRTFVSGIDYNAKGQRVRIQYGDGAWTAYSYNDRTFRLETLTTKAIADGRPLQELLYTYDPVGNIVSIQDKGADEVYFDNSVSDGTALYEYDAIYRLRQAKAREQRGAVADEQRDERELPPQPIPHRNDGQVVRTYTESYTYDAVGNFLSFTHASAGLDPWTRRYQYIPGTNRLAATSLPGDPDTGPYTALYPHDVNGNMTALPHLPRIDWTFKDEMQRVDRQGGGIVYFVYDSSGERVRKVWEHDGVVDERIYLGSYEIYRRRVAGTLTLERQTLHVMDDERRIALVETKTVDADAPPFTPSPRVRFQLGNHLGSVCLEIDETARVISYEEYHPYGTTAYRAVAGDVDVSETRYRYTGKERDEETGLSYHGARYYAAWLGRWTASDPAGCVDGPNLYCYVRGNPVTSSDPSGREAEKPNLDDLLGNITVVAGGNTCDAGAPPMPSQSASDKEWEQWYDANNAYCYGKYGEGDPAGDPRGTRTGAVASPEPAPAPRKEPEKSVVEQIKESEFAQGAGGFLAGAGISQVPFVGSVAGPAAVASGVVGKPSRTFQFWYGAGQFTAGVSQIAAGIGAGAAGGSGTVGGVLGTPFTGGLSLGLSLAGVSALAAGGYMIGHGIANAGVGILAMANAAGSTPTPAPGNPHLAPGGSAGPGIKGTVGEEATKVNVDLAKGTVIGEQVTLEAVANNGLKIRIDVVQVTKEGYLVGLESKFGDFAGLTKNQQVVIPRGGGWVQVIPRGARAQEAGLTPGQKIWIFLSVERRSWSLN